MTFVETHAGVVTALLVLVAAGHVCRDVFYNRYGTGKPALVILGGLIGAAMFFAGA